MDKASEMFDKDVRPKMFPLFSEFAPVQKHQMFIMVGHFT